MKIEVIKTVKGLHFSFEVEIWKGIPNFNTSNRLAAPQNCINESIVIERNDTIVASGSICWVGTHGAMPCFYDLTEFGQYKNKGEIFAKDFEDGDVITITPVSHKTARSDFDRIYWANMVGLTIIDVSPYEN